MSIVTRIVLSFGNNQRLGSVLRDPAKSIFQQQSIKTENNCGSSRSTGAKRSQSVRARAHRSKLGIDIFFFLHKTIKKTNVCVRECWTATEPRPGSGVITDLRTVLPIGKSKNGRSRGTRPGNRNGTGLDLRTGPGATVAGTDCPKENRPKPVREVFAHL